MNLPDLPDRKIECYSQAEHDELENGGHPSGGLHSGNRTEKMQAELWDRKIFCDAWRSDKGWHLISASPKHLQDARRYIEAKGETVASQRHSSLT
jgi:hypothetical protein